MPILPTLTGDDVDRIVDRLYLLDGDSRRKLSAFWVLLALAAVIASAGIVGDSTATVIGAMIVAPLMTPILGTALALVLGHRRHLFANLAFVLGGAVVVVVIGYLIGLVVPGDVVAATNSQVAGRVSPKLIDLIAAVATGLVGAFALIRSDVSDTLPGVAIAISLVPPLAVVGLTLESGAPEESAGALLLFGTNVAAIIATGTLLLAVAGIREATAQRGVAVGLVGRRTVLGVVAAVVLVAVPLGLGSLRALKDDSLVRRAQPVAASWAAEYGWTITGIDARRGRLHVTALGPLPEASEGQLRSAMDDAGLTGVPIDVTLVIGDTRSLGGD